MTARNLYEGVLIELHKENAPNILLEDFNYFANKAINQYINKRYNIYDINQQTTDDLRVLKATAMLDVNRVNDYNSLSLASNATYETILPQDYLHILNCICIYTVNKTYKCYNQGDTWRSAAKRLTADAYSQVLDNFWNKPTYKRPYYYIHNVNTSTTVPTNPVGESTYGFVPPDTKEVRYRNTSSVFMDSDGTYKFKGQKQVNNGTGENTNWQNEGNADAIYPASTGTRSSNGTDPVFMENSEIGSENSYGQDGWGNTIVSGKKEFLTLDSNGSAYSNIERGSGIRYGNASQVRLEIRYGTDNSIFELTKVYIDYIKAPQNIRLTQEELDYTEDRSQMLEFPDYVCQEIINELVHLIMENISDQRLQTHPVVSQSIANPAQQQTEPVAQQQPT